MKAAKILAVVIPLAVTFLVIYGLTGKAPSGGMNGDASTTGLTITAEQLQKRLAGGEKLIIIDVREPDEWEQGHIPGARLIPLGQIGSRSNELDPGQEIILVCRSGNRSGQAQRVLEGKGFRRTVNMVGGMLRWNGPVVAGREPS